MCGGGGVRVDAFTAGRYSLDVLGRLKQIYRIGPRCLLGFSLGRGCYKWIPLDSLLHGTFHIQRVDGLRQ